MTKYSSDIESLVKQIEKAFTAGVFKNYVKYIRFPFYKNLGLNAKIDFSFPVTIMVGPNGSGKSSALHAIYGMPEGYSPGHFWFSTNVDPIADDENNRHCLIYGYEDGDKIKEVLKTRIGSAKGSHYWEPSRPIKKYGMETMKGSRHPTIKKNVVYLDFRAELSAYDQFFYFSNFKSTKRFKSKQDSIRIKSRHLKNAIDTNSETKYFNRRIDKPDILNVEELKAVNEILGKDYVECMLVNHNLYSEVKGLTIYFKTKTLTYSEAFAGRGEFAVVKLVHEIMNAASYSLILLDEPEVSLHPGAQVKLLKFILQQTLKKQLQVVLSTHSSNFVEHLPENAIKLFYSFDNARFAIKNNAHHLEAFQVIGQAIDSSSVKHIYVEDFLSELILKGILDDLTNELKIMYSVERRYGGSEDLLKKAAHFSQEQEMNRFLLLDGDKRKEKISPEELRYATTKSLSQLSDIILAQTGLNFKALPFSIDSKGSSGGDEDQKIEMALKYLNFLYSNVDYFPGEALPEDIIWNVDLANKLLLAKGDLEIKFIGNGKENIYAFANEFVGNRNHSSYETCLRIFVVDFIKRKDENYQQILAILNKFKSHV